MHYSYDEVLKATTEYFNGDELASKVWVDKYALRNQEGELIEKTPTDMHNRLAKEFHRIETSKYKGKEINSIEEFNDGEFSRPLSKQLIFSLFDRFKYVCVAGDNWVLTSNGPKRVVDLIGKPFIAVVNNRCYRTTSCGFVKTGNKKLLNIKTSQGFSLRVTEEHPILVHTKLNWYLKKQHSQFIQAKNIKIGDKIVLSNNRGNFWSGSGNFDEGWLIGQLIGDGTFTSTEDAQLYFYRKGTSDFDIAINLINKNLYLNEEKINGCQKNKLGTIVSRKLTKLAAKYNITKNNKFDLSRIQEIASSDFCRGLICGLFDADGHIFSYKTKGRDVSIRLTSIKSDLLLDVQKILARLGIMSTIYLNRRFAHTKIIHDKIARCKDCHELRISKDNILFFASLIGSYFEDKKEKLDLLTKRNFNNERFFATVNSIEIEANEDVYDVSIENIESFDCNGVIVHNCPQGSPMYGIGNDHQVISLSNCYLLDVPLDSYNSILDVDKQLVNISKRRGGVGIDLSNLRPKNSPTKNAAHSSTGIVSWMERYSNSIREVGQNSRRGALMLTLCVHHPDILDFCTVKNDNTKVTGANITVRLSREFIDALKKDEEYELRWPVDSTNPKIKKRIRAKDVWDTIITSSWLRAEPGISAWYNVTEQSPSDCYEDYKSQGFNPCLPGYAKILKRDGIEGKIIDFKDVKEGDFVWSRDGWVKVLDKFKNGLADVYKYVTTAGIFYGTKNHKIESLGVKKEVGESEDIDIITGPQCKLGKIIPELVMDGLVLGDGGTHKASGNLVILYIGDDDTDYFGSEIKDLIIKHRPGISSKSYEIKTSISPEELPYTFKRKVPTRYIVGSVDEKCSFLRGLYSANGSVCGNRITLKAASFDIIEGVQLILSSLGIRSYWTRNKKSVVQFENGQYECKESYDLNISKDREKFIELIGFIQKYKNEKIRVVESNKPLKTNYDIIDTIFLGQEEVFDIRVDGPSNTYWTQGCSVSNCSEINLSPLDSCRLICINLFSYVENPCTKDAVFNYEKFKLHVKIAQRLMDDLVDLESEKIQKILEKIDSDPEPDDVKKKEGEMWEKVKKNNDEGRRTGLGITALGDCLAALNIKYGSDESILKTEKIYKTLKLAAYKSSVEMAKLFGPFKVWDSKKEVGHPFLDRIQLEDKELFNDMQKYGRRNIALLTTAPTGTVSCLTQTTSGIEPIFMLSYTRRKKINHSDKNAKVDFIDQSGDKWQEFVVYHEKIKEWMRITGKSKVEESPWFGASAEEIDWVNRVKLQAAAQKHVCHGISSCLGLNRNMIQTDMGLFYIEELANIAKAESIGFKDLNKKISSINKSGNAGLISQVYNNGICKTYKVELSNHSEISTTENHKLCVLSNDYSIIWKEMRDIGIGDYVVIRKGLKLFPKDNRSLKIKDLMGEFKVEKRNINRVVLPEYMTNDLARFIGYMCSDGSVGKNGVSLSQELNEVCHDFSSIINRIFGLNTNFQKDKRTKNLYNIIANSRVLSDYCKYIGLSGHDSIRVPKIIRQLASFSNMKNFIRGITLDGYVTAKKIGVATSVSRKYLLEIQQILLNFGISSSIFRSAKEGDRTFSHGKKYKTKEAYTLIICDKIECSKFANNIGFAEKRKDDLAKKLYPVLKRTRLSGSIPDYGIRKDFKNKIFKKLKSYKLWKYCSALLRKRDKKYRISRENLCKLNDLGLDVKKYLLDETYDFLLVIGKEEGEEELTFDISIPDGHSYLVNSIIGHNTLNLPENVSKEEVAQIYETAFDCGLKGVTVYRKNCRSGVLVENKQKAKTEGIKHAPKRPKELPCDIYISSVNKEKFFILIGKYDDKPYEVFAGKLDFQLDSHQKSGIIKKEARGRYSLSVDGEVVCKNIIDHLDDAQQVITRLTSTNLRHEACDLSFLVQQLLKSQGDMTSLGKVIARCLKHYIKEGTVVSGEECQSCGGKLLFSEGCVRCSSCSYTKCS